MTRSDHPLAPLSPLETPLKQGALYESECTSGRLVRAVDNGRHLIEADVRLTEVDRFVHLNAMQRRQLGQRLGRFHPISAIADDNLQIPITAPCNIITV